MSSNRIMKLFPEFLNEHNLAYLNFLDPYLQEQVKLGTLQPHIARLLNFKSICELLKSEKIALIQVKAWNYRQTCVLDNWFKDHRHTISFDTILTYLDEERIYNKLCFSTIYEFYALGVFNLNHIEALTEKHCLVIVRHKTNILSLIQSLMTVEEFLAYTADELDYLELLDSKDIEFIELYKMNAQEIMLHLKKTKALESKLKNQMNDFNLQDNLKGYYTYLNKYFCTYASQLIEDKVVSLEMSDTLSDSNWMAIAAWYKFPVSENYETILISFSSWSSRPARRYPCSYRLTYIDQYISERDLNHIAEIALHETEFFDWLEMNYDTVFLPLLKKEILTLNDLLGLDLTQLSRFADLSKTTLKRLLNKTIPWINILPPLQDSDDELSEERHARIKKRKVNFTAKNDFSIERHPSIFFKPLVKEQKWTLISENCKFDALTHFIQELVIQDTCKIGHIVSLFCAHPKMVQQQITNQQQLINFFEQKGLLEIQQLISPILREWAQSEKVPSEYIEMSELDHLGSRLKFRIHLETSTEIEELGDWESLIICNLLLIDNKWRYTGLKFNDDQNNADFGI